MVICPSLFVWLSPRLYHAHQFADRLIDCSHYLRATRISIHVFHYDALSALCFIFVLVFFVYLLWRHARSCHYGDFVRFLQSR